MDKKSKQLDSLRKQQEQIKARIQALEASEKMKERKLDTRRKICIGAYYLDKARKDGTFEEVVKLMDGYLKRNSDRVLFDLSMIETEKSVETAS